MAKWKWVMAAIGLPFALVGGGIGLQCIRELQNARPFLVSLVVVWPVAVIFSLVGWGLILIAIFGKQVAPGTESPLAIRKRLMGIRPPQEQWRQGQLLSQGQMPVFFGWLRLAAGSLMAAPLIWVSVTRGWFKGDAAFWPWSVSALIPVILGWQVLYRTRRFYKYGSSTADILERPGPARDRLRLMIRPEKRPLLSGQARVRLQCEKREMRGSGKHRRLHTDVLWTSTQIVDIQPAGLGIDVAFAVPREIPDANPQRNEGIFWLLEVGSAAEGVDYHADFEVPLARAEPA